MKHILFLILLLKLALNQEKTIVGAAEFTIERPYFRYCHKCEGHINSDPCAFFQQHNESSFSGTEETRCRSNTEECYTSVHDGIVRRGCLGDGYCDSHECETCKYMYCNGDNKATKFCIQCTSLPESERYDENCMDNPEKVTPISCAHKRYQLEDVGCYSMNTSGIRDGVATPNIVRGCIGYSLRYPQCYNKEDKSCFLCQEDGCNTHDMSFSAKIYPTAIILILSLTFLLN